jgi:SAM-dependent methyltransferase
MVTHLSDAVGPSGKVVALDVSAPLIARTKERTVSLSNVECVLGDASRHPFGDEIADLIISRLGVMFFGDPPAAFAHLRRALFPTGRIVFACWRSLAENAWMSIPVTAAAPYLPPADVPQPGAPGPFAFADSDRIRDILTEAGYSAISIEMFDPLFSLLDESGLEGAVDHATNFGPCARRLAGQPDNVVAQVRSAVRDALREHETPTGLFLPGALWIVQAKR